MGKKDVPKIRFNGLEMEIDVEKKPISGQVWIRNEHIGHEIKQRRMLIMYSSDRSVFFEWVYSEAEGTVVEVDRVKNQEQWGIKRWQLWAKTAWLEGENDQ